MKKPRLPMMRVVYVAGPYRSKYFLRQLYNIWRARKYARILWRKGIVALCPHSNSALFDDIDDVILPGCIELMLRCDAVFVMPGSDKSSGVKAELETAEAYGLPVYKHLYKLLADAEMEAFARTVTPRRR